MEAAKSFFEKALAAVGQPPEKITTDGHDSYPVLSRRRWVKRSSTAPAAT
jgi:transposase-like protein